MADQEDFATLIILGLIALASSFSIFAFYFLMRVCQGLDRKTSIILTPGSKLAASAESLENNFNTQNSLPLKFSLFQEYYSCERVAAATSIGLLTTGISLMTLLCASGDMDIEKGTISAGLSILLGLAVASALICAFHHFCGNVTVEEKGKELDV